jgi:lipopolysaccharide/colanic/teichoic acid biosynthesis glycosyltransferase
LAKNVRNAILDYSEKSSAVRTQASSYGSLREVVEGESLAGGELFSSLGAGCPEASHITSRHYRVYKRWMDVGLVLLTAPFLLALFAAVAAVVRFSSKGSIFYKQKRIGQYGTTFTMYKFRTMKVDADQILMDHLLTNPAARQEWMLKHKLSEDPRLSSCGRFLRTASLDELPQIWNVLRGDMSLVGPRPIVWAEKERYADRFRFYTAVLPGLTGLWQVSGRSSVTYPVRVRLDEQYVREWSLLKDFRILLRTPLKVWSREGAY